LSEPKPFQISKWLVVEAYRRIKANKGRSGIDAESLQLFEQDLKNNLYKLWNRLSSGSYIPPSVMRIDIEKSDGGTRRLGIPTVTDRIAQMVVKLLIEPNIDPVFHPDSYGYRPNKSAHQALKKTNERCGKRAWVLDMDIQGFFDNIDHALLMKAVRLHVKESWQLLYIERWITASIQHPNGQLEERQRGTPQGGVISPLLANLFLHYVFDVWITKHWRSAQFERYADDIVFHCASEQGATKLLALLDERFKACGLQLHPEKTKIVYCKGGFNREKYPRVSFDFLGFTFKPLQIRTRKGNLGLYFMANVSQKSAKRIRDEINSWHWRSWVQKELKDIQSYSMSRLRGWVNYYRVFNNESIRKILYHFDQRLARWAKKKYKKLKTLPQATARVSLTRKRNPNGFPHWCMVN